MVFTMANVDDENDVYAAVQYVVQQICEEQDRIAGNYQTSARAVASISELLFQYATNFLAKDLDTFAQHGGRKTTISENDVKLTIRRNTGLELRIERILHESIIGRKTKTSTNIVNYRNKSKTTKRLNRAPLQKDRKKCLPSDNESMADSTDSSEDDTKTFKFGGQTNDIISKRNTTDNFMNKSSIDQNLQNTDSDSDSSVKRLSVDVSNGNASHFKLPRQDSDTDTDLDYSINDRSKRNRMEDECIADLSQSS